MQCSGLQLALPLFVLMLVVTLGPVVHKYSLASIIPATVPKLTAAAAAAIAANHSVVLVGGPHRGGTTLLWRLIAQHPNVSSFGTRVPSDYSEGAFLQSVLPTFGVGEELLSCQRPHSRPRGVGSYALLPGSHLIETSSLNNTRNRLRLLSEWGAYWDLRNPILLEKTPTNMVASRLLQALLPLPTAFVFISRHPLAVALAERHMASCSRHGLPMRLLNWIAAHQTLAADLPHLHAARVLRYEDLVTSPHSCLGKLSRWLGLPPSGIWQEKLHKQGVSRDTNSKYETEYCHELLATETQRQQHCAVSGALQPSIEALGLRYDVLQGNGAYGFGCVEGRLRSSSALGVSRAVGDVCARREGHDPLILKALRKLHTREGGYRDQPLGGQHLICSPASQNSGPSQR